MNEITTPFDFFLSSLKSKENEEKENDFDIEKTENGDYKIKENNNVDLNILKLNLDEEINENEIEERIKESYMKNYKFLNLFENKDNIIKKIEEKKADLLDINYIEKILLKQIDDYRIEEFNNQILKRKGEIIEDINKRKINNKKKRIIYLPIIAKKEKKDKKNIKDINEKKDKRKFHRK